jgi:hypothetical protein
VTTLLQSQTSKAHAGSSHPIEGLFTSLQQVRPYIGGMVEVPRPLSGLGFFPGGDGLWKPEGVIQRPPLPVGGIMILGNNFQCEANFEALAKADTEDRHRDATWRNLIALLGAERIEPIQCFFTNAFMGLVEGSDAMATVPAMRDAGFVGRCRAFLEEQLRLLQPRLVLALGTKVPAFLAPLSSGTRRWERARTWTEIDRQDGALVTSAELPGLGQPAVIACLLHPSFRGPNLRLRKFQGHAGAQAERELIQAALRAAGLRS